METFTLQNVQAGDLCQYEQATYMVGYCFSFAGNNKLSAEQKPRLSIDGTMETRIETHQSQPTLVI